MNKTVNINLAGTFFHIDEDAFGKLNRYLDAIKRSFTDSQGRDEIIKDIEARIAELFSERIDNNKQVITIKELDEVITIMGQPEDYAIDDEIFDDTPKTEKQSTKGYKKLFRDSDNKYIGGVSSGLGHYLGLDAIWIRLIWILLTIFSSGTFILIYIIFWILVPEAVSTADKLTMRGEPVNISNIERKFKETYDNVADKVKNADYDAYGKKIKSSSETFFDTIGKIVLVLLTIFVKFIGVIIIITAASTLIALFVGLFITGISGVFGSEFTDFFNIVNETSIPIWLLSLLLFLAIGIPFFFLFILGLKILIDNLKSIGRIAKLSLLGLWLIAVISLVIIGVLQATERAYDGNVIHTEQFQITSGDTLNLVMRGNNQYQKEVSRSSGFKLKYDENDNQILYSNNIRLVVKSTRDSIASLMIDKKASGSDYLLAKNRANAIDYSYEFKNNTLSLDGYFLTDISEKYREQAVELTLYLPEGSFLYADRNVYSYHRNSSRYRDILLNGQEEHYLEILDGETRCETCLTTKKESIDYEYRVINWDDENWAEEWKKGNKIIINKDGIDINVNDLKDSVQVKLNKKGIKIKTN